MFRLGIKNLTMDDIAQQLGISKKTLYQIVDNKAELVTKVMSSFLEEETQRAMNEVHTGENAIDRMLKMYQHHNRMAKRIIPSLSFELQKYFPDTWAVLSKFREDVVYPSICANIRSGIEAGLYRADINVEIIAWMYVSSRLYNTESFSIENSYAEILTQLFNYHIRGIASAKGLKYLESLQIEF
jgi:AcrR family transcriptional regulator